jgi:DNA-binding winged helix-turn-helix (wHTH) protein
LETASAYRFGSFEADLRKMELRREGIRLRLERKPWLLLLALLERPGEVVTRAELERRLWGEGVFVDFEHGVNVAVKKVRSVLCDSPEAPRYIETVAGVGYRFIGEVEAILPAVRFGENAAPPPPAGVAEVVLVQPRASRFWPVVIGVASAVAVLALELLIAARPAPVSFQSRDWVLVAAFENRTGEKLFDGTMEYALARELSESHYVNVVPQARVNDTLALMRQPSGAVLNEELARQVALRDGGIKLVLDGRTEKFGDTYVFTVRAEEPGGGKTVAVFSQQTSQPRLLEAVRVISDSLRRRLGEAQIATPPVLEKATTSSLAALQAFTAGMKLIAPPSSNWTAGAGLFEEAVRQDPQFASAHIYLAHCYSNLGKDAEAAPHYRTAFAAAPNVTERERLFILGSYYQRFVPDPDRARAEYEALVARYPDDFWGANNLVGEIRTMPFPQQGDHLATFERFSTLRPNDIHMLFDLWYGYQFLRPDATKAARYRERLMRLRGPLVNGAYSYGWMDSWTWFRADTMDALAAWRRGDVKTAAAQLERLQSSAASQPEDYRWYLSQSYLLLGKTAAARQICHSFREKGYQLNCLFTLAYATGNRRELEQLERWMAAGGTAAVWRDLEAIFALQIGDAAPVERVLRIESSPILAGAVQLARGHTAKATQLLRGAISSVADPYGSYFLACALEREGKLQEAIAELESDSAAPAFLFRWWSLEPRVKLAELYRKAGREADARTLEDELRAKLSEADPDFYLLPRLRRTRAAHRSAGISATLTRVPASNEVRHSPGRRRGVTAWVTASF